jgi:hypothetical protein
MCAVSAACVHFAVSVRSFGIATCGEGDLGCVIGKHA